MRKPLIAGNWKMNGSRESIATLLDGLKTGMGDVNTAEVAVCAPSIYIADVQSSLEGSAVTWGGQDVSVQDSGAYTGETAASMLLDFGCKYAIIGHSERRTYHAESDALVAEKFEQAINNGLVPLFCIGETLEEREQGITEDVVARQIDAVLERVGAEGMAKGVIAYEPVWAIGTGKTASPEQAQDVHAFIRGRVAAADAAVAEKVQILYGGSMNAGNAAELLSQPDIDGGLIGGASLKADDFLTIARAANQG
ncbi:triose-phosphate isomerase [Solemya velum gill symbiont]|uniref:Triosephosphate isomerase n=3 Tax=Solemya velum gill symbiont TaxID=2340 RepID=A0A0B0HDE1_SOVGS|nr:triose-phosphate isomerase [Solemya velum gill symbiont]KHF25914.1 triosephosphate isomerase [Solemya velum gill symbiont]OOY34434.1 triose-phosphate isomerase [Solemya velum gill symbiont]OOY37148.1 triose-phosphate isomerase [Solemya velum gill symbiont]OOY41160.1 triose-phosphate isomerase [Solemya velum gill symbiont]OOY41583.1 triose-phosphate isomerase [Solemya velum gill symbiont]